MNAEIFMEWMRRQGHTVIRTESSYWYNGGPGVYQAFPYHALITPSQEEMAELFDQTGVVAARYSTPVSAPEGLFSYHAINDEWPYSLEKLPKSSRQSVRRGLSRCRVEQIPFEMLADQGYALQADTLARQNRKVHLTREEWRTRCLSARDLEGFEAWGALVGDDLAASVMAFRLGDWVYFLYQQSQRKYLSLYVNNALAYTISREYGERPGVKAILYGLHSLDAPSSIDEFKFRMGYRPRPVRQRVVFHPAVDPFVGRPPYWAVTALLRLFPGNPILSKAEGIMRFHLQGRLPAEDQPVPLPLEDDARRYLEEVQKELKEPAPAEKQPASTDNEMQVENLPAWNGEAR